VTQIKLSKSILVREQSRWKCLLGTAFEFQLSGNMVQIGHMISQLKKLLAFHWFYNQKQWLEKENPRDWFNVFQGWYDSWDFGL